MTGIDTLTADLQQFIAADSTITTLVGHTNSTALDSHGNPIPEPWVFRGTTQLSMESTKSACLVLAVDGQWRSPNSHNAMFFPRLSVEVWVDPDRDSGNNSIKAFDEVVSRAMGLWLAVDKLLHRPQGNGPHWGTKYVEASTRLAIPSFYEVPNGNGLVRGVAMYALTMG